MIDARLVEVDTITICGSMRFYDDMIVLAQKLTLLGNIVLMPFCLKGEVSDVDARMLDELHRRKIDASSKVFIVTDSTNYIGESTISEIEYVSRTGTQLTFWRNKDDMVVGEINLETIVSNKCPYGHSFAQDLDETTDCCSCAMWDACAGISDGDEDEEEDEDEDYE